MHNRALLQRYGEWRAVDAELVLVTVVETAGSTYSKAGRQLLIGPAQEYVGLVGGGCLEGDLLEQAERVAATGQPELISYDMRDDADDLWGIGLGCRGLMRLLLQPLSPARGYEPFAALAEALRARAASPAALAVASDSAAHPIGSVWLGDQVGALGDAAHDLSGLHEHTTPDGRLTALHWTIRPWPRLLVLGAGPDVAPMLELARTLGWEVTVADHRAALLETDAVAAADEHVLVEPEQLQQAVELGRYTAVLVMSHHLHTDTHYIASLAEGNHEYVGMLGPRARCEQILSELGLTDSAFAERLHGPVGLDIGAATPAGIALATLAEIHARLHGGSGRTLSEAI